MALYNNVVIFLADDYPYLDGSKLIDQMDYAKAMFKDNGVQFSRFRTLTPLCGPCRAEYLTGKYASQSYVVGNDYAGAGAKFAHGGDQDTIVVALHNSGYRTMMFGKYNNQYGEMNDIPEGRRVPPGWDVWKAFEISRYLGYNYRSADPGHDGSTSQVIRGTSNPNVAPFGVDRNAADTYTGDYSTRVFGNLAVDAIGATPGTTPIFMWLALTAIHDDAGVVTPEAFYASASCPSGTWDPPNRNVIDTSSPGQSPPYVRVHANYTPAYDLTDKCRVMQSADDAIERIVRKMISTGRTTGDHSTLFLFLSDNSKMHGEHKLDNKSAPYLAAMHTPCYAHWLPSSNMGTVPRTETILLGSIDIAPTVAEVASVTGVMNYSPTGVSFKDYIAGTGSGELRPHLYFEYLADFYGDFVPQYQGIETSVEGERYWEYPQVLGALPADEGAKEFYKLGSDPWEMTNLYGTGDLREPILADLLDTARSDTDKRIYRVGPRFGQRTTLHDNNVEGTGTNLTLTIQNPWALGDATVKVGWHIVVVAFSMASINLGGPTLVDTGGNTYTQHIPTSGSSGDGDNAAAAGTWIYSAPVTTALVGGDTIVLTWPTARNERRAAAFAFMNGKQTGGTWFKEAALPATGTSQIVTGNPVDANEGSLILSAITYATGGGAFASAGGSGWTYQYSYEGTGRHTAVQSEVIFPAGSYTPTAEIATSATWRMNTVVFDQEAIPESGGIGSAFLRLLGAN